MRKLTINDYVEPNYLLELKGVTLQYYKYQTMLSGIDNLMNLDRTIDSYVNLSKCVKEIVFLTARIKLIDKALFLTWNEVKSEFDFLTTTILTEIIVRDYNFNAYCRLYPNFKVTKSEYNTIKKLYYSHIGDLYAEFQKECHTLCSKK